MEQASQIKNLLEQQGIDVWFDKARLEAGDDYTEKIYHHIENCSLFLPVISHNTTRDERRFFRLEWNKALKEVNLRPPGQPFIIPVITDDTSPGDPSIPREFRDLHWARLENNNLPQDFYRIVINRIRDIRRKKVKEVMA